MSTSEKNGTFQAGFTLVEIAIVMVIIGLLIGGVLKGQAMIREAKVKRVVKTADELRAAINTFYDKYGLYPGDENNPNIPPGDTHEGDGSGQISSNERFALYEDLAKAKIIGGSYNGTSDLMKHPFGGNVAVYWSNPNGAGYEHYIFSYNLPWDVCLEIDTKYDDGVYNTGSIRASGAYSDANSNIGWLAIPL